MALLCVLTLSCVDNNYDINNLSKEVELFKNSLNAPVGTATIRLDSVIGGLDVDTSILSVKNGRYVFSYSGNFDLGDVSKTLNDFTLKTVDSVGSSINLYDGSALSDAVIPFQLPGTAAKNYTGSMTLSLPAFSTSLIDVDSISLKNTYLKISAECFGLTGGNGKSLGNSMSITLTAVGNSADYYDLQGNKINSWTIKFGETSTVEVRKLRLTRGNNYLSLTRDVQIQIANAGDVMVTDNIQTYMNFSMKFLHGVDYSLVWGKVNYSLQGNLNPINFDALGTIINDNDVLSIYNPTITLKTEGNLGVPINLDLKMSTKNTKTGLTRSLNNAQFKMLPSTSPSLTKINTFFLDKANGTSELFKINPDQIILGYKIQTDVNSTTNHFVSKNSRLTMSYKMEIPLEFGSDLKINLNSTVKNPLANSLDKLKDQKNLSVALTLNVKNRVPLAFKIGLTALDNDSLPLFEVVSDTIIAGGPIDAATGFATAYKNTTTEIGLTPAQINKIKYTKQFRVNFLVIANKKSEFVTVQPTDDIIIKIGAKINGGVVFDLSTESK
jgi:hypothetical protein